MTLPQIHPSAKKIWTVTRPYFTNFYLLSTLIFIFWMLFVDTNNLEMQLSMTKKKEELMEMKQFYKEKTLEVRNNKLALENDLLELERVAREKYFMKKKGEDIYIVNFE